MKQVAVLRLGTEYYALDIMKVNTIKNYETPNRIPHPKPFVKGVINLRGQVVPILDLRTILGYEEVEHDSTNNKSKIIIIENEDELLGLIIDEVLSISQIDDSQIDELDKIGFSDFVDVIESVAKFEDKLVAILSIPKILEK